MGGEKAEGATYRLPLQEATDIDCTSCCLWGHVNMAEEIGQ